MNIKSDAFFRVNSKIYSLEAVLAAGYNLIDRFYVLIDKDENNYFTFTVWNKSVSKYSSDEIEGIFLDELVNEALRIKIAKKNQKIREMIVNKALYSASTSAETVFEEPMAEENDEFDDLDLDDFDISEEDLDFLDDPLGIAVPWEEKHDKDKESDKTKEKKSEESDDKQKVKDE